MSQIKNVGFFPGQGSQQVGMGAILYTEFASFRQTLEEASDTLRFDLKKLCFEGPESDLTLTHNAQPAILAISTACYRVANQEFDLNLGVNLGHSLGEYSALVASAGIPFQESLAWVRERGLAMQRAVPVGAGGMCAILGAEDTLVETWCKEATELAKELRKNNESTPEVACTVEPANYNAPGQVVVSGSIDAIDALEKLIQEKKIRGVMAKRLNVSAPFHCSLMKPARETMDQIFKKSQTSLTPLKTPYIPNRTARITSESGIIFDLLSEQIDHSVLWKQSVETLFKLEYRRAFEFGPGKVLQGLSKRIAKETGASFEVLPIFDLESLKAAAEAAKKQA